MFADTQVSGRKN